MEIFWPTPKIQNFQIPTRPEPLEGGGAHYVLVRLFKISWKKFFQVFLTRFMPLVSF